MINDQIKSVIEDGMINNLCSSVVSLDKAIVFCAIAQKSGYLVTLASNHNGRPPSQKKLKHESLLANTAVQMEETNDALLQHLTDAEIAKFAFHAGIICGLHKFWQRKLGSIRHFVSYYDEMPLVTIVFDDGHFLLMGIDSAKRHGIERILSHKVMPFLQKGSPSMQK